MNPSLQLRGGNAGQTFEPSTPGYVLAIDDDGLSVKPVPIEAGGDHKVSVSSADQVPNYLSSKIAAGTNIDAEVIAPGADELLLLSVSPALNFPAEDNAGNVTGAVPVSLADSLTRRFTLTGNATVLLTGLPATRACWFQLKVIQGGTGSYTLTLTGAKTPGGAGLTLSTPVGAQDIVSGYWDGTTIYAQVAGLAFA